MAMTNTTNALAPNTVAVDGNVEVAAETPAQELDRPQNQLLAMEADRESRQATAGTTQPPT